MSTNIVSYESPKLRNLPAALTPQVITAASLPLKVEAARKAIAECEDLDELLTRKDQVDAMAAAIKTLRHTTPEMVRSINRMCKEAVLKLGQLVDRYTNAVVANERNQYVRNHKGEPGGYTEKQARAVVRDRHGLKQTEVSLAVRLHKSPESLRRRVMADDTISAPSLNKHLPKLNSKGAELKAPNEYAEEIFKAVRAARTRLTAYDMQQFRAALTPWSDAARSRAYYAVAEDAKLIKAWLKELSAEADKLESSIESVREAAYRRGLDERSIHAAYGNYDRAKAKLPKGK